jgi:hypothetical protein
MGKSQSILGVELSEEDERLLLPSIKAWKNSIESRDTARLDFQSKMSVLSAGSIAVLASGAVAIANSAALQRKLPAHLAAYVIIASSCLWVSLVCSTVHNYLEIALLERESRSRLDQALLAFADLGWKRAGLSNEERRNKMADLPLTKESEKRAGASSLMARIQPYLTLGSVVFFCVGYLPVLVFICMAVLTV